MNLFTVSNSEESILREEKKIASCIQKIISEHLIFLTAEHPAGRKRTNPNETCNTIWYRNRVQCAEGEMEDPIRNLIVTGSSDYDPNEVGNVDKWPGHEGVNNTVNDSSCLRMKTFQIPVSVESEDLIEFANRVMLHCCSSYCLRKTLAKDNNGNNIMDCRMHFRNENPNVKAHTDGKLCRKDPVLVVIKGIVHLELPRDHPRFVQGSIQLSKGWSANFDFQVILGPEQCMEKLQFLDSNGNYFSDAGEDRLQESVLEWMETLQSRIEASSITYPEFINNLVFFFTKRKYLDNEAYMQNIIDYACGYVTKGETSPDEALQIYKRLLNTAADDTEFGNLAQKVNMALLKTRSVCKAESVFLTQGLPCYSSTCSFMKISLNTKLRVLAQDINLRSEDSSAVSQNQWDKFLAHKRKLTTDNLLTFDEFNRISKSLISVYSNAKFSATIPFQEDFPRTVVTLHKPNIRFNEDLKLENETWVDSLNSFLSKDRKYVPQYVIDSIKRAHFQEISGIFQPKTKKRTASERPVEHDIDKNFEDRGVQNDGAEDIFETDEYSDFDIKKVLLNLAEEGYTPSGELVETRKLYPSFGDMENFIKTISDDYYGSADRKIFKLNMNKKNPTQYLDPLAAINNTGRRIVLCRFLTFLKQLCIWQDSDRSEKMPEFYAHIAGVAGTGKSFIMGIITNLTNLCMQTVEASECLAPTGGAAGSCGGSIVDRDRSVNRTKDSFVDLGTNEAIDLQNKYKKLKVQMLDEISMWGKRLLGQTSYRCGELFNEGHNKNHIIGNLPCSIVLGDLKQLPPVKDLEPHLEHNKLKLNAVQVLGREFYTKHDNYFILDTPMRQNEHSEYMGLITRIRNGKINSKDFFETDQSQWNSRRIAHITDNDEKNSFSINNDRCLFITCLNKDRDIKNSKYIQQFNNIHIVRAILKGVHVQNKNNPNIGQCNKIPSVQYAAVGQMVILLLNPIPEYGLFNTARGIIRDIIYKDDADPSKFGFYKSSATPIFMIEFLNYTGPPLNSQMNDSKHKHWVPVSVFERRCGSKKKCCSRIGIPICVSKAASLHSVQGISVGKNKPIEKIVFTWNGENDARWPGAFYVGGSRVEDLDCIALENTLTDSDIMKIGSSNAWIQQNIEIDRMTFFANATRQQMFHDKSGTKENFIELMQWFTSYVTSLKSNDRNYMNERLLCITQYNKSINEWISGNNLNHLDPNIETLENWTIAKVDNHVHANSTTTIGKNNNIDTFSNTSKKKKNSRIDDTTINNGAYNS